MATCSTVNDRDQAKRTYTTPLQSDTPKKVMTSTPSDHDGSYQEYMAQLNSPTTTVSSTQPLPAAANMTSSYQQGQHQLPRPPLQQWQQHPGQQRQQHPAQQRQQHPGQQWQQHP